MHSSHSRNRPHRSIHDDDDDIIRRESSADPFHRRRQYARSPDPYRPSSARSSYTRESLPSRHHEDWGTAEPSYSSNDRYSFSHTSDGYSRTGRDNYDVSDTRDGRWASPDTHYRPSEDDWRKRYDHAPSSTYPESSSWAYDTQGSRRSHWAQEEPRGGPSIERGFRDDVDERQIDREVSGWGRNGHRDGKKDSQKGDRRGGNPSTWTSDVGWQSRRSENRSQVEPERSLPRPANQSDIRPAADERAWEPAPSWQPSKRSTTHGNSNHKPPRSTQQSKSSKGGKKNHAHNKQQRSWRNDETNANNPNNWSRRNINESPSNKATPRKRRQQWSRSRSRSRSPADSYHSRRSSRGRSRSRSTSPKRQRRDGSTLRARSRSPNERSRAGWGARRGREYSKSPTSSLRSRNSRGYRRRSLSSASSTSRSRSSSRSPADRPRAKHRLPPATSLKDIAITIPKSNTTVQNTMLPPKDTDSHRLGAHSNGHHADPIPNARSKRESHISGRSRHDTHAPVLSNHTDSHHTSDAGMTNGQRPPPVKNAGFKPIGQTSSAVKRFFPNEDEDEPALRPTQQNSPPLIVSKLDSEPPDSANTRHSPRRKDYRDQVSHTNQKHSLNGPSGNGAFSRPPLENPPIHSPARSPHHQITRPSPDIRDENQNYETTTPLGHDQSELQGQDATHDESRPDLYAIVSLVGEGTFGKVYKARNTVTKVYVALKRIRMESERDGFPVTAMREIKLLQSLRHPNIVRLYEMMVSNGSVYMVFEYSDHDLTGVLSQAQFEFTNAHLKSLCHQMIAGLAYLHHKGVIHRDIKGSNILLNNRGELKLADFGLARFYQKRRRSDYTNRVITLWYRPPELLFGATVYGPEVDMWSAGCIMLELFTKKPVFQGNDEIHQLDVIYKIFGTPIVERWPGLNDLPWYELVKPREAIPDRFRELFRKWMSPAGLDLAEKLLAYDPVQRATAQDALEAPYFRQEQPPAAPPVGLATLEGEWHELETKRERAKKRRKTEPTMP